MKRIAFTVGVSLILGLSATTMAASANDTPQPRTFSVIIELAGADESNRATKKELKESGTKMIPAAPTAQSRDPLKPIKPVAEEKPAPVVVEEKIEEAGLNKDSTILLMCRSGTRSAKAAALLNQLGYSKAYTVVDGFEGDKAKEGNHKGQRVVNGWKNSNLPWTYKITEDKMYFE